MKHYHFNCEIFKWPLILALCLITDMAFASSLDTLSECHPRKGLPNFFDKINNGQDVTVVFLGGSITHQQGWRPLIYKYFASTYPNANFVQVNAAISGTDSRLGACRLKRDVLSHKPDLVFLEYAVNDGSGSYSQKTFEGIVRQIYQNDPMTDICIVYTINNVSRVKEYLWKGVYQPSAQQMEVVAEHYGIPSVHMAVEVARLLQDNKLIFKAPLPADSSGLIDGRIVFSPDGTHPYPQTGHKLYCQSIVRSIPAIIANGDSTPRRLPSKLLQDSWDNAKLISLDKLQISSGWQKLDPENDKVASRFVKFMPNLWMASQPGDEIRFSFIGTDFGLYGLKGPDVGQISIQIDDKPPFVITFFDSFCTANRWTLKSVFPGKDLPRKRHDVTISIHPELPDKAAILTKGGKAYAPSDQFLQKRTYLGDIEIVGDLVP